MTEICYSCLATMQMVDLKDKDPEVAAHLEAGTVPATEDSIAVTNPPPGFADAVVKDPSEPAMGVQVAEQALAEGPSAAPNKSSPEGMPCAILYSLVRGNLGFFYTFIYLFFTQFSYSFPLHILTPY